MVEVTVFIHAFSILIGRVGVLLLMLFVLQAAGEDNPEQPGRTSVKSNAPAETLLKNWPSFRGPNALGHAAHSKPPLKWNAADGTGILWKIALPKHGMSSLIAWGDRIFLTGADEDS